MPRTMRSIAEFTTAQRTAMRQLELIDRGIKDLSFEFLNQDGDEALRDALSVSRILAGALNVLNARGAVPPVVAVPPAEGEGGTNGNA